MVLVVELFHLFHFNQLCYHRQVIVLPLYRGTLTVRRAELAYQLDHMNFVWVLMELLVFLVFFPSQNTKRILNSILFFLKLYESSNFYQCKSAMGYVGFFFSHRQISHFFDVQTCEFSYYLENLRSKFNDWY